MGEREPISGLLDEDFISIYPSLAVRAGINKAAILQKLHYLVQITRNSNHQANHIEGRWWVYNTYAEWRQRYFPWLAVSTLKRLFLELEQDGIVLSWAPADNPHKKYYTIDYDYWPTWFEQAQSPDEGRSKKRQPSSQNETTVARLKTRRSSSQNETTVVSKRDDPSSQIETTIVSKRDDASIYKESETTQRRQTETTQTPPTPAAPASQPTAAQPAAPAAGVGVGAAAESSGDDDLAFILPAVRRLHLSAEAQQRLLALGAQTALAIAFAATAPSVRNPAGLAVKLMDNGGPSEFDLERAALALELRTLDTQELDRHQHRREYERLAQQAEERWAAEQERNASAPPVAAGASPGDDGLDYRPGDSPMTLRDWWWAVLDNWERMAGHPLKPAVPLRYADGVLTVQVGLANLHWWQTRAERIGQMLSRWIGEPVRLEVVLSDEDRAARERFEKLMAEVLAKRQPQQSEPAQPVTGESASESEASPQAEPDEGERTEAVLPSGAAAVVLPAVSPEPVRAEPVTSGAEAEAQPDGTPAAVEDPGEPLPPPPPELDPAALPGLWQQALATLREQELPFSLAEISRLQVAGYADGVVALRAATAQDYQWLEGRGLTLGYVQNVLRGQAGESLQIRLLPPDPVGAQEQEVVRA